jgi:hypothetical protein
MCWRPFRYSKPWPNKSSSSIWMFDVIINHTCVWKHKAMSWNRTSYSQADEKTLFSHHTDFVANLKGKYTTRTTRAWCRNDERCMLYILPYGQRNAKASESKLLGTNLRTIDCAVSGSLYAYKDSWPLSWKDLVGHGDEVAAKIQWFVRKLLVRNTNKMLELSRDMARFLLH